MRTKRNAAKKEELEMVTETLSKAIEEEGGALVPFSEADAVTLWRSTPTDEDGHAWPSDGNEDIEPSFPAIKIVQPTSTMAGAEKHVGEFYHSDLDAYTPDLDVVGLVKRDTRAYFTTGEDAPRCMSNDGVAPVPNMPLWTDPTNGPEPQLCEQCPFSAWHGETPPPCRKSMVVLVDRGEGDLAQLRIGGKSIRPYIQFVKKQLRGRGLPLYSQRLALFTEMKSEPGKRWAELVINGTTMAPREAQRYADILIEQRRRFEETVAAEGGAVEAWVDDKGDADLPFE